MDVISTIYKELFQIKLVHTAFNNASGTQLFQQVTAVPDYETQRLFDRLSVGYKCVNDTIICFIQSRLISPPAKEPKTPFVTIAGDVRFRFLLSASSGFFNKTYVASTGSKVVYYFTNRINHVESAKTYISKSIDTYDVGKSYDAGDVPEATSMVMDLRENYHIFCSIVVYPVIPKGDIIYRIIPTASHSEEDINLTLKAFEETKKKLDAGVYKSAQIPDMAEAF